jgi:hypothetical protein
LNELILQAVNHEGQCRKESVELDFEEKKLSLQNKRTFLAISSFFILDISSAADIFVSHKSG